MYWSVATMQLDNSASAFITTNTFFGECGSHARRTDFCLIICDLGGRPVAWTCSLKHRGAVVVLELFTDSALFCHDVALIIIYFRFSR